MTRMSYRPEIDGVRAVAVVSVILYHAGLPVARGGFVGVDVFFVISGYLICSIIHRDIAEGRFSLAGFYERRARRILPALYVVCMASFVLGWMWMLPREFKDFSKSLVSVVTFWSNIHFLKETDYFNPSSSLKPLLHTWSLSVEEQFYILFPFFLISLRSVSRKSRLLALFVASFASFVSAHFMSDIYPSANFYLLLTRAWELGFGALVALGVSRSAGPSARGAAASWIGLAAIGFSIVWLDDKMPFPGVWALPPVFGTGLLLAYSSGTSVGRLLGVRPLVAIGVTSYSAYLLHQPIFAFARLRSIEPLPLWLYGPLIAATFIGAAFMWRYVESPFRDRSRFSRRSIARWAFAASACLLAVGAFGQLSKGAPWRQPGGETLTRGMEANRGLDKSCEGAADFPVRCATSSGPEIIVWGDSYAMHLVDAIVASNPSVRLVQATKSACGPFFDVTPIILPDYNERWAQSCLAFNDRVKSYIEQSKTLRYAVLSSPFATYLKAGSSLYTDGKVVKSDDELVLAHFQATLRWLASRRIVPVIISPPPADGRNIGDCVMKSLWLGQGDESCKIKTGEFVEKNKSTIEFLKKISDDYRVIFLWDYLCDEAVCAVTMDGNSLYIDDGHLSHDGSSSLGKRIDLYNLVVGG